MTKNLHYFKRLNASKISITRKRVSEDAKSKRNGLEQKDIG